MIPNCKKEIKNKNELLDLFYPVGIYIETSDGNFNPNTSWGGVWVEDTKGLTTVSAYRNDETDPNDNAKIYLKQGEILGETKHALTVGEMPSHNHSLNTTFNATGLGDKNSFARPNWYWF